MDFTNGLRLRERAHELIPGGCHTYAKGDDQYPQLAPPLLQRGAGCRVWDLDGNEFIEYGMGMRAVTLGHAYAPVVEAAYEQMLHGNNFTRAAAIEVEYAEALLSVLPHADMVKFAKDGSTVTTAAIKLARAHTGRDMIAYCKDHPFFSYNDWFLGTTLLRGGVPAFETSRSIGFRYNDVDSLKALFKAHPDAIACVILEPERDSPQKDDYLKKIRNLCQKNGALLIFDEMITGFRWHIGGAQTLYDVAPDLSTFGKAIANGFALSALVGKREIMELGGLHHNKERVFLLSTTHGAENHALAAGQETLEQYQRNDVVSHLHRQGDRLTTGIKQVASNFGLSAQFKTIGRPCNLVYTTLDGEGKHSPMFRTLFLQEMIRNGVLAPSFVTSYSHTDSDIDATIDAVAEALVIYKRALENDVKDFLVGAPVKSVYRTRN